MGAADAEGDERPIHRVYVSEFFIGRFAVTNDEYARFVQATGHPPPIVRDLPLIARGEREPLFRRGASPYVCPAIRPPSDAGPSVVLVRSTTLADVNGCRHHRASGRLPTEAGGEGRAGRRRPLSLSWGHESTPRRTLQDRPSAHIRMANARRDHPPTPTSLRVCGNVGMGRRRGTSADS